MLIAKITNTDNKQNLFKINSKSNYSLNTQNNTVAFKQFTNSDSYGPIGAWYHFFATNNTAAAIFSVIILVAVVGGLYWYSRSNRNHSN